MATLSSDKGLITYGSTALSTDSFGVSYDSGASTSVDDIAWGSDWDEFDHILTGTVNISLSGTVAPGATETFSGTINHAAYSDVLTETYVSQSAVGYTGYEEPIPPHLFVYIPATGTGVPTPGASAYPVIDNDGTTTTITVYINNPSANTWTLTSNTLTFRHVVTDVPWE